MITLYIIYDVLNIFICDGWISIVLRDLVRYCRYWL